MPIFDGFRNALWYCLNQTPIPQYQLYYYFFNNIITIYFSTYVRTRRVDEDPTAVTLVVLGLLYIYISTEPRGRNNISPACMRAIYYISPRAPARGGYIFVQHGGPGGPECYTKVPPTRRGGYGVYPLAGTSGLHGPARAKSARQWIYSYISFPTNSLGWGDTTINFSIWNFVKTDIVINGH